MENNKNIRTFLGILFPLKESIISLIFVFVCTSICYLIMRDKMLANDMIIVTGRSYFDLLFLGIAFPILSWPCCIFVYNVFVGAMKQMTHWTDLMLLLNPIILLAISIPTIGFIGLSAQSLASYTVIKLLIPS